MLEVQAGRGGSGPLALRQNRPSMPLSRCPWSPLTSLYYGSYRSTSRRRDLQHLKSLPPREEYAK